MTEKEKMLAGETCTTRSIPSWPRRASVRAICARR